MGKPLFDDSLVASSWIWETEASADRKAIHKRNVERFPDHLLQRLSPRDAFALRYVRNAPQYLYNPSYDLYWAFAGKQFSAELITYFLRQLLRTTIPSRASRATLFPYSWRWVAITTTSRIMSGIAQGKQRRV